MKQLITLSKLNEHKFILNCSLIETMEETPDTIITLTNGKKYIVKESIEEVVELVIAYNRSILSTMIKF